MVRSIVGKSITKVTRFPAVDTEAILIEGQMVELWFAKTDDQLRALSVSDGVDAHVLLSQALRWHSPVLFTRHITVLHASLHQYGVQTLRELAKTAINSGSGGVVLSASDMANLACADKIRQRVSGAMLEDAMDEFGMSVIKQVRSELYARLVPWWSAAQPWTDTVTMKTDIAKNGLGSVYIASVLADSGCISELVTANTAVVSTMTKHLLQVPWRGPRLESTLRKTGEDVAAFAHIVELVEGMRAMCPGLSESDLPSLVDHPAYVKISEFTGAMGTAAAPTVAASQGARLHC